MSKGRGFKLSDLSPALRAQVQGQIDEEDRRKSRDNRAKLLAQEYAAGSLELWAPGEPPTVTHQSKHIAWRKGRPTLRDDDRLLAAREHYAACFGHNPDKAQLAGPIEAAIQVRFLTADGPPAWWEKKPDADNAAKAVLDAAVKSGFIRDEKVSILIVEKLGITTIAGTLGVGVLVKLRTLERPPAVWKVGPIVGRITPRGK